MVTTVTSDVFRWFQSHSSMLSHVVWTVTADFPWGFLYFCLLWLWQTEYLCCEGQLCKPVGGDWWPGRVLYVLAQSCFALTTQPDSMPQSAVRYHCLESQQKSARELSWSSNMKIYVTLCMLSSRCSFTLSTLFSPAHRSESLYKFVILYFYSFLQND